MSVSQQTLAASASDPKIGALELQKIHQQLHYQCKWAIYSTGYCEPLAAFVLCLAIPIAP